MTMEAKIDAELLVNAILPFAEKMLTQHGEFYPYGGYTTPAGKIIEVGAKEHGEDYPRSKDLLKVLRESFQAMARSGKCKAAAIVFDVSIVIPGSDLKSDAIQISVDHRDGYSADVFYPYQLTNGNVVYGATFAQAGKREIFVLN
jgi:hypothetical protein